MYAELLCISNFSFLQGALHQFLGVGRALQEGEVAEAQEFGVHGWLRRGLLCMLRASRVFILESGRRPTRALLFFVCPKKRRQKKRHPNDLPSASLRVPCAPQKNVALMSRYAPTFASPTFFLRCSAAPKGIPVTP